MIGDHEREHAKRLHNIELALDRIAKAIEELAGNIERVTGRTENRQGFIRVLDLGRHE